MIAPYTPPTDLLPPNRVTPGMVEEYFSSAPRRLRVKHMAEEIARLNAELQRMYALHHHIETFLNSHGGPEVWEQGQILELQKASVNHNRRLAERSIQEAKAAQAKKEQTERELAQRKEQTERELARQKDETRRELSHTRAVTEHHLKKQRAAAQQTVDELQDMASALEGKARLGASALEEFAHPAESFVELKGDLREVRADMKSWVSEDLAVAYTANSDLPSTPAKARQMMRNLAKLALRCYNLEAENIIQRVTAANIETSLGKLERSADTVQRLTKPLEISIDHDYQKLKARELELAAKVESARKLEREAERERRAEMREQAQIDAELEAQRKRLEKEKGHYEAVLQRIEMTGDQDRAEEIRQQLVEIESGIADVDYRQANSRAGYVYIISNIGAFGEHMVKIGMTRRLEPMDRVRELGDASVPFGFDVHALFFAEDAVSVEAELHRRFADKRVNRVNLRREFFYATPVEVREELEAVQGDLLEFVEIPEAEQYRASLQIIEDHGTAS